MKYYTLLKKGTAHPEFCEDFIFVTDLDENFFVGAVFDGCSGGDDAHFASTLFAKTLRDVCCSDIIIRTSKYSVEELAKELLFKTFKKVHSVQKLINLNTSDLLTTVIIVVYGYKKNNAHIIVAGDGFVSINGVEKIIEQNNRPDYPAYYLDELQDLEGFEKWYKSKILTFKIEDVKDISIASDGILSFRSDDRIHETEEINPVDFLSKDISLSKIPVMLYRKYNIIKNKAGLINFDDIAMIRIIH